MTSPAQVIIDAASAKLNPWAAVSDSPTTMAHLAAPAVLRTTADLLDWANPGQASHMRRWADEIDAIAKAKP